MKTDFEGAHSLLEKDSESFLGDMESTLIAIQSSGLSDKREADLLRAIHAIKSLVGMLELQESVEFISDAEFMVQKVFDLGRKEISIDLLNHMFELKDRIESLVRYYILSSNTLLSESIKMQNKALLDRFERDYIEYKLGKGATKNGTIKEISEFSDDPMVIQDDDEDGEMEEYEEALFVENDIMYFSPKSLKQEDVTQFHAMFLTILPAAKQIEIDLNGVYGLDFTGVQFIQSIKKHCKISGTKLSIEGESNLISLEASILGVKI